MNIFFHETNSNKYSINTLTRAVEDIENLKLYFFSNYKDIKNLIKKNDVIAFSFMTHNEDDEKKLAMTIEAEHYGIRLIAGGPAITDKNTDKFVQIFDNLFIGEGEEILRDFISGKIKKIAVNNQHVDINKYGSVSEKYKRFGSIEITRGCPYGCFYCETSNIMGKIQRHKRLELIRKEIEILLRNNFKDIRFITPDLASYGSKDGITPDLKEFNRFVDMVCEIVKGRGRVFLGSFPSEIRPEHISDELCEILKGRTSSKTIIIGAQSGSDEILKKINRRHSVDDVIKAVATLVKYGFSVDVDFIFGFPFETEETLNDTKKLITLLIQKYRARIHIHYFMPLPSTPFENLTPKLLTKELRKYLSSLTSKKLAFGQWENQLGQKS
ncbi:MAG: TIGR04013 family B12-binding domain/radical SAM domain-containing protein [Elusimicrobia bacterium]|nr:TIGR04013 family B12-binding domain/radical SAM domain-containing protein [Elusimicrobiota bacterium]